MTYNVLDSRLAELILKSWYPTAKAVKPASVRSLERIARKFEPALRDAFLAAVRSARSQASIDAISQAMAAFDPAGAIREASAGLEFSRMRETLADIVEAAGESASARLRRADPSASMLPRFDIVNPHAVTYARSSVGELIREFTMSTQEGVQDVIANAIIEGIAPRDAAKQIRDFIGLDSHRTDILFNYQSKLEAAGETDIPTKMQRYADKLLRQRALTIARTETINAAAGGQQAAWQSAIDQGFLDKDVEQVWIVGPGACEKICQPMPRMEENQNVRIGGFFLTGDSRYVSRPPAHPNCRCTTALKF